MIVVFARCLLFVVWFVLFVACCLLFVAGCVRLLVVCCLQCVVLLGCREVLFVDLV